MAKVSLIIPAYNAEDYIERCIESVCGQSERDIQIVVVNDGSTDRTKDIVEQLAKKDKRITLINQDNHNRFTAEKRIGSIKSGISSVC